MTIYKSVWWQPDKATGWYVTLIQKPHQPHYGSSYNNLFASFYYRSSRLVDNIFLDLYMKFEFWKLKERQLDKHIGCWKNTDKMDIKEAWRWVLDWIYLIDVKIRNRAFVNMAMKFELLCDCQRVKKSSTPLIMFVTRHTILDLVNQKASPLNFVGQFTTTKTNCASIPVLFTVKITVFCEDRTLHVWGKIECPHVTASGKYSYHSNLNG